MFTYIKAQATLVAGSLADYAVTILLVEILHTGIVPANVAGTATGGILQFMLGRNWAFRAANGKVSIQVIRYLMMTAGNIILSTGLIYLLTHFLSWNYLVSKTIISIVLGLTYNYYLQKKFVFAAQKNKGSQ